MKNYNVIFSKGHLVDRVTGKRVHLKRGAEFAIQGDDEAFVEQDPLMQKPLVLNAFEKEKQVKKKHPAGSFVKIAEAGQHLAYKIGLAKRTQEDKNREFWFIAELLEDLYLFENKKGEFNLFDCHCKTIDCIYGGLILYEEVYGYSLSNLFSNMVAFYFPLQRSGAANAFKTFYISNYYLDKSTPVPSKHTQLERLRETVIKDKAEKEATKLLRLMQAREKAEAMRKRIEKLMER